MKNIVKALLALVLALSFAGCAKGNKDVLVMGTNAAFPPFEYIGGANGDEVVGFDVEIAEAIAEKAGKTLKIEDMEFDTLLTALNADKVDFTVAGMTITEKRAESVNFSEPYYEATQAVLVLADNESILSVEDLNGKEISVQLGTTGDGMASELTDTVVAFNTGFEALMELKNGKVDALIIDEQPAINYLKKNPDVKQVEMDFDPEYYGIAVKKGNDDLLNVINETLAELKVSGKYDELIAKYMK